MKARLSREATEAIEAQREHARAHRLGDLHAAVSKLVEAHSVDDVAFVLDAIRDEIAAAGAIADHARKR